MHLKIDTRWKQLTDVNSYLLEFSATESRFLTENFILYYSKVQLSAIDGHLTIFRLCLLQFNTLTRFTFLNLEYYLSIQTEQLLRHSKRWTHSYNSFHFMLQNNNFLENTKCVEEWLMMNSSCLEVSPNIHIYLVVCINIKVFKAIFFSPPVYETWNQYIKIYIFLEAASSRNKNWQLISDRSI